MVSKSQCNEYQIKTKLHDLLVLIIINNWYERLLVHFNQVLSVLFDCFVSH